MKPLVLAGLAAAAYYAYKKMTPEQKENIKNKGKDLLSKLWPPKGTGMENGTTNPQM
jgi:hypothetical protein